tara:strand:- start:8340 stop:9470 length:1131 start_codon:yes stop_codon:yes gene_type:complete
MEEEHLSPGEINRRKNQTIQDIKKSNSVAFNSELLANPISESFGVLNEAFKETGQEFAQASLAINKGYCGECIEEKKKVEMLNKAPEAVTEFLQNLAGELSGIESENFDINNNSEYTVLKAMIDNNPGFSPMQGFTLGMTLDPMVLTATGPGFAEGGLKIAANSLQTIIKSGGSLIAETPKVQEEMVDITKNLLQDGGMIQDPTNFTEDAAISDDFFIKENGKFKYEQIDLGENKARNVLIPDEDKIISKARPYIDASIAFQLQTEENAVALYNTMLKDNVTENEQLESDKTKNAGDNSWIYKEVLPLSDKNKKTFGKLYENYWKQNYLNPFIKNQLPKNPQDQEVFEITEEVEENKKSKRDPRVDILLKKYGVIK